MNKEKLMYALNHPDELPERAAVLLPSDKTQVIIVTKGQTGYYPYQSYPTKAMEEETCTYMNQLYNCTKEEAEAMQILSMRSV
jgi:hypothetical protein